jgi:NAD(P)-dependent dehydrogenase (short-subunit alcohol dehydrogenase family)
MALADAGCDVAILELNTENARKVAEEIKAAGKKALVLKADVIRQDEVNQAFETIQREFGGLDICVNNAGVCIHQAAEDTPEKDFDYVVDINLKGVFFCCQAAFRLMKPQKKGSIINTASMSGTVANYPQKQAHYNASKAGVVLLTKCLAVEWAPYGIRVNCLSPGYTRTEMTGMAAGDMIAEWERLTPMGRMGQPEELAGAVIYMASDAASFTTGSDIIVDGGFTAR